MILLILFSSMDFLELSQAQWGTYSTIWYANYTWDAEQGDTLVLTPQVPLGNYDKYVFVINGDARYLTVFRRYINNLPTTWEAGGNTGANKRVKKIWHPWEHFSIQFAMRAEIAGERYLRIWFIEYGKG